MHTALLIVTAWAGSSVALTAILGATVRLRELRPTNQVSSQDPS